MNLIANAKSAIQTFAPKAQEKLARFTWKDFGQAILKYSEDYNRKAEDDTLTFKEAAIMFLFGMAVSAVLCAFGSWLG